MYTVTKEEVLLTIPGSEKIPRSTDLSGFSRKFIDENYCDGDSINSHKLDLVLPNEGDGPFPVVMFIHGGGWLIGDKAHVQTQQVYRLLFAGYAVCCINYRLSDEAKWPGPLHDCKAAVRYLRANAKRFGIDADHIGVVGNSAGGHLAAMMGTTNGQVKFEDPSMGNAEYSSDVQAVFCWFGAYDLENWREDWQKVYPGKEFPEEISAEAYMLGHRLKDDPERVREASPICHIGESTVPFYVEHGTGDHAVPYYQCMRFYDRYVDLLGDEKIRIKFFEGAEHSDSVFKTDENVFEFVKFFDQFLLGREPREYFKLGELGDVETIEK